MSKSKKAVMTVEKDEVASVPTEQITPAPDAQSEPKTAAPAPVLAQGYFIQDNLHQALMGYLGSRPINEAGQLFSAMQRLPQVKDAVISPLNV